MPFVPAALEQYHIFDMNCAADPARGISQAEGAAKTVGRKKMHNPCQAVFGVPPACIPACLHGRMGGAVVGPIAGKDLSTPGVPSGHLDSVFGCLRAVAGKEYFAERGLRG